MSSSTTHKPSSAGSQSTNRAVPPAQRHQAGRATEQLAARFLTSQGLSLIETNYHCRLGEIDLIMRDADSLVFVEVRYRSRKDFICPATSVNYRKQQKLIRTALVYLKHRGLSDKLPCRFDVLGINRHNNTCQFDWIRDAIRQGF
jgi:putative endonuclease